MKLDHDKLLERARSGDITEVELSAVVAELEDRTSQVDPYGLLHIIGHAGDLRYRPVVESFLTRSDEPMLARLALQILCKFWNQTENYLSSVASFIEGAPWDFDNDVRQIAISCAGEYLRGHREPGLLKRLLDILDDENEPQTLREDAYLALARAVGREWSELPRASRHFDLTHDTDPLVVEKARGRLREEASSAR